MGLFPNANILDPQSQDIFRRQQMLGLGGNILANMQPTPYPMGLLPRIGQAISQAVPQANQQMAQLVQLQQMQQLREAQQQELEMEQEKMRREAEDRAKAQGIIAGLPEEQRRIAELAGVIPAGALDRVFPGPQDIKTRERYEGGTVVQEQLNPKTLAWEEIGRGPRWSPTTGAPTADPSNVREYQYFLTLSPEQQQQYLIMKRANPYVDLGGEKVLPNPAVPGGVLDTKTMTLPPEQTPETKAAQTAATTTAEISAKRSANMGGVSDIIDEADALLSGTETGEKPTQSGIGTLIDKTAGLVGYSPGGAEEAARLRVLGGQLVSKMPRMEGPQSNYDVVQYQEMAGKVGDSTVPIAQRRAALKTVRSLTEKYTGKQAETFADGVKSGSGWKIEVVK